MGRGYEGSGVTYLFLCLGDLILQGQHEHGRVNVVQRLAVIMYMRE